LRLIHAYRAVHNFSIIQLFDRTVCLILIGHFNKTESAGAAGFPILYHPRGFHIAVRLKRRTQVFISGPEREIPNIYFHNTYNSW
jgi:hypothetical protein